jgi:hypothetical protein
MLGAVDALQKDIPNLTTIDARGSRQMPEATRVLRQLRSGGELGKVVIVHIGDNGVVTDGQFDQMMQVLSGAKQVIVVNTTVPDGYRWAPNNEVLADGVARHQDKAVLVDWHAESFSTLQPCGLPLVSMSPGFARRLVSISAFACASPC